MTFRRKGQLRNMCRLVQFPAARSVEFTPRESRLRFIFKAVEGHPPEQQKKLVLEAREIGLLTNSDTTHMLNTLKLQEA